MRKAITIIAVTAGIVVLPFLFRPPSEATRWRAGDPELVVVSPHNEAIRDEFGRAFSVWHEAQYGRPVKVEWRVIGGTTEIMRYLASEYAAAFRAWWKARPAVWPAGGEGVMFDTRLDAAVTGQDPRRQLHAGFRSQDDAAAFGARIDLFFGGGAYDHGKAAAMGMTVPPWPAGGAPPDTLVRDDGLVLIPEGQGGEVWRTDTFFGTALSAFGICVNLDRMADLGITNAPRRWRDLTDPAWVGHLAVADPTKSGSIAKAFEMIIHEQCHLAVERAGFADGDVAVFEEALRRARWAGGALPEGIPAAYQAAVEAGWLEGVRLVQRMAANARYFTDSASMIPVDVGMGNAAAGLVIDFYGRFEAEATRPARGASRLIYLTPQGGSSVSADPISLLRGAPNRETAVRFMAFVLGAEGQKLWTYRPGTPGGPVRYALRRLPIRRDFYPGDTGSRATFQSAFSSDDLGDPAINPYAIAGRFVYHPRWTARHFNAQRNLIRAMGIDAGEELQRAWRAILAAGGPQAQPEAMRLLARMPDQPEPLTWGSVATLDQRVDSMTTMRAWTGFFRQSYREAQEAIR